MTPTETDARARTVSRRSVLRRLLAAPLAVSTGGLLAVQWSGRRAQDLANAGAAPSVFRGYVAGFQFHDGPAVVGTMTPGDEVTLVREPENRHDRHAIRIDYRGRKIGYVPRSVSEHVAHQLGDRPAVRGTISAVQADALPWRAVRISAA